MWQYNYNSDELYHYGKKGMKWGVRKKDIDDISKNSDKTIRGASDIADVAGRNKKSKATSKAMEEGRKMSDQELQKAINRMDMEKRYSQLQGERNTSRGAEKAKDALSVIGSVVAITAGTLGIALSVRELAGK